MGAVTLVARAELRRQRTLVALLALVVALVAGAVFTAAAGARRTATVLDRYLEAHPVPELIIGVANPRVASDADQVRALEAELSKVRGGQDVVAVQQLFAANSEILEEEFTITTGPDIRYLEAANLFMLEGRMPAVDGTGEVALNEGAVRALGVDVGEVLVVPTITPDTAEALFDGRVTTPDPDGPELRFEVVGVYRDPGSFADEYTPEGIASPDAGKYVGEAVAFETIFVFSGDHGAIDADAANLLVNEAVPDGWVYAGEPRLTTEPTATAFDSIATGLGLFAAVALLAGLIALGQMISRQVAHAGPTADVTSALGMRDRAIVVASALPSTLAVGTGVVVGAAISLALSPRFPISVARRAEVDPGIRVDWPVLVGGSGLVLVAMSAWALAAGWTQVRRRAVDTSPTGQTHLVRIRRALPVAANVGCASVLAPQRGRAGVRPGSAIVGAVVGVAGVLAIAVFTVSQRATADDPSRYGWNWDSAPNVYADDPGAVVDALAEDPRLAAVGGAFCDSVVLNGSVRSACALQVVSGSLHLTYLDGRAPSSPDEIAIGRRIMTEEQIDLGDTVEVTGESGATRVLQVIGTVVQPEQAAPGEGLVLTEPGFRQLTDDEFRSFLLLKYPQDAQPGPLEEELASDYSLQFIGNHPQPPQLLSQLERVRPTLVALAAFLCLLGVVGLVHFLLLSANRRRRDAAVLETMGFVRRQTRAVVAWQALTISLIGVVVGTPLGAIVGRSVWIAAVDQIGIVDRPTMPWLIGIFVIGGALLGSVAVSLLPEALTARRNAAEALRTE